MSELGRSAPIADVVRVALSNSVDRLVSHERAALVSDEPEHVHQARVATRRMRSDLRTFGDFVEEQWATELRGELRWLAAELGEVRDIEVLCERLRDDANQLETSEHDAAERVIRRLLGEWRTARARLSDSLSSVRYTTLRDRLVDGAQHPRCTTWANLPAGEALPRVVRRRWNKLRRAVDALGDDASDDALHTTRIHAKRARYAAEATIPVFGQDARRFGKAIANVQEILGEHHDAVVARAWITKTASESRADEAFAAGRMTEMETRVADAARAGFWDVWAGARGKHLRAWL